MSELADRLLAWHARHGRHDLPWQHPRTAYRVWVAEIMLQQTQVATVLGYYRHFLQAMPDLPALAAADEQQVLALWSGLGYYRRARNLHRAAQRCMQEHNGELPADIEALQALPGIGRSTAAAIVAQAHGQPQAILDGNAKRVLARHFGVQGWPGERTVEKRLWSLAEANTPDRDVADYTQAIMDLGATVCTRSSPQCTVCPLATTCVALEQGLTDALPAARPRKALPERQTWMLVLRDRDNRVLLERRDGQGVWPGLWCLPQADDRRAAGRLASRLALRPGRATELPVVRHGFSHYKLDIRPLFWGEVAPGGQVRDNQALRWQPLESLDELGLPAPVRTLLGSL